LFIHAKTGIKIYLYYLTCKIFGHSSFIAKKLKEVLDNKVVVRFERAEGNTGGFFLRHQNFQLLKIVTFFCFCNTLKRYFYGWQILEFDFKGPSKIAEFMIGILKYFFYFFKAIVKYFLQLLFYKQAVGNISQNPKRQFIMYNICHFYPTFNCFKMMLVMP
jgi:hypothetical protein